MEAGQSAALQLLRNEKYRLPETEDSALVNGESDSKMHYTDQFTNHQSMPDLAKLNMNNQGDFVFRMTLRI